MSLERILFPMSTLRPWKAKSNFEIARLDWFRSKEYEEFFEMMDRSGGFWMERVSI